METFIHGFAMTALNAGAIDRFALSITLLGYLIVFLALVLLYLTFRYLVPVLMKLNMKGMLHTPHGQGVEISQTEISGEVNAAISVALFLYFSEMHDPESDILTIRRISKPYSPWSSKIYGVGHIR